MYFTNANLKVTSAIKGVNPKTATANVHIPFQSDKSKAMGHDISHMMIPIGQESIHRIGDIVHIKAAHGYEKIGNETVHVVAAHRPPQIAQITPIGYEAAHIKDDHMLSTS